jgi:DNA-binding CsgD family transcriptional regulator
VIAPEAPKWVLAFLSEPDTTHNVAGGSMMAYDDAVSADLTAVLTRAAASKSYAQLRSTLMEHLGQLVSARAVGLYLFDEHLRPRDVAALGVPDTFLLRYEEIGRRSDPLMAEMSRARVPLHNLDVCTPKEWQRQPLYTHVLQRFDIEHVLEAPLVDATRVIGALHFGRSDKDKSFDAGNVRVIAALASHLSALIATLPSEEGNDPLTPRELEIAQLVAAGLNNREIGDCLSISRNTVKACLKRLFAKIDVSARAEMVSQLVARRIL